MLNRIRASTVPSDVSVAAKAVLSGRRTGFFSETGEASLVAIKYVFIDKASLVSTPDTITPTRQPSTRRSYNPYWRPLPIKAVHRGTKVSTLVYLLL
ncbi:hypothetical protein RCL1_008622 [Eukaryota sp. TZLM3-RCL]